MEQRVSVVTLGVRDLERAGRFYEQGLGRKRGNKGDDIVFFQANGMIVALFPWDHLAADAEVPPAGEGFRGVTFAYCTRTRAEVDTVLAQAQTAGARVVKTAQDVFWGGYSGYFADPDGPSLGGGVEPGMAARRWRQCQSDASLRLRGPHAGDWPPNLFKWRSLAADWARELSGS